MKIAICDDEEIIRKSVIGLLKKTKEAHEIKEYENGIEFVQKSNIMDFDVLFLDIEMDGMSGIEVAKAVRDKQESEGINSWGSFPLIVFITGYKEHMEEAFLIHAFGYIIKPINELSFQRIYGQILTEYKKHRKNIGKTLVIKTNYEVRRIEIGRILYVESDKRKNIVHMPDENITYYGSIAQLEDELPDSFFRIHKGYLVNMKYISKYDKSQVFIKNGDSLLISKYRYPDFVKGYMSYLRK